MGCNCHGKSGVSVTRTSPFDQCSACAKKHVVKAWNLWNEFTYTDDNRDTELTTEWDDLLAAVREAFNTDYPAVAERLEGLCRCAITHK